MTDSGSELARALVAIVDNEHVLTSPEDLIAYSYDASAPNQDVMPLVIVLPGNQDQVSQILRYANQHRIPVVPRGSGTGLAGSAIPVCDSILLPMTRMNQILEIDEANLTALVEPGVLLLSL